MTTMMMMMMIIFNDSTKTKLRTIKEEANFDIYLNHLKMVIRKLIPYRALNIVVDSFNDTINLRRRKTCINKYFILFYF